MCLARLCLLVGLVLFLVLDLLLCLVVDVKRLTAKAITTAVELSKNSKTGPVSATYTCQQSCPSTCPFLPQSINPDSNGGCYGNCGNVAMIARRLNNAAAAIPMLTAEMIAEAEAEAIDQLSGRNPLRLHVVGDSATDESANLLAQAAKRYRKRGSMYRSGSQPVWSYCHAWQAVKRISWGVVSVLASVHDMVEGLQAHGKGYALAMTVERHTAQVVDLGNGFRGVACLEQTKGINCVDCGLCFDDAKLHKHKIVILFAIHSTVKRAVESIKRYLSA